MLHHLLIDHIEPCVRGRVQGNNKQKPIIVKCLWSKCNYDMAFKHAEHIGVAVSSSMAPTCLKVTSQLVALYS